MPYYNIKIKENGRTVTRRIFARSEEEAVEKAANQILDKAERQIDRAIRKFNRRR